MDKMDKLGQENYDKVGGGMIYEHHFVGPGGKEIVGFWSDFLKEWYLTFHEAHENEVRYGSLGLLHEMGGPIMHTKDQGVPDDLLNKALRDD